MYGSLSGVTRELAALTVTKVSVGPMDNNAYLLRCRATGEQLLIDAAAEPETLLGLARLGDVGHRADDAIGLSVGTPHRHTVLAAPAPASVGAAIAEIDFETRRVASEMRDDRLAGQAAGRQQTGRNQLVPCPRRWMTRLSPRRSMTFDLSANPRLRTHSGRRPPAPSATSA